MKALACVLFVVAWICCVLVSHEMLRSRPMSNTFDVPVNLSEKYHIYVGEEVVGRDYVDEVSIKEVLPDGTLGPNLLEDSDESGWVVMESSTLELDSNGKLSVKFNRQPALPTQP